MEKKKIKIFLASSEELENDRNAFGNLVRRLDKQYEKRGIRIELFEWEEHDAAYNSRRKQDEYNEIVRASDMFLALFHKRAGQFTIEEFDVASAEFKRTNKHPKTYVYCRKVEEGEQESDELKAFKKRLLEEMGHYWSSYDNRDSMQLHFVMQLMLVENSHLEELKLEDGDVRWGEITVAQMEKLSFAADNADYQSKRRQIAELKAQIEEKEKHIAQYPGIDIFSQERQQLIDRRSQLQEELEKQQELLFSTAKHIAELETGEITERMQRAIEAFTKGNVAEANAILREAEYDASDNLRRYRHSKALNDQDRKNVVKSIEELLLKTSTIMADTTTSIGERTEKTAGIFAKIDEMATEIHYDKEKHSRLLYDYAKFLYDYGRHKSALGIVDKLLALGPATVQTYNLWGNILYQQDEYEKALKVFDKALDTLTERPNTDDTLLVETYNNIGQVYNRIGAYDKAKDNAQKALKARTSEGGREGAGTAKAIENVAESLWNQGAGEKALTYYKKALEINKRLTGEDSKEVAINYRQIGESYRGISDDRTALEYYRKALTILEKKLGPNHPETALTYGCIGASDIELLRFHEALEYTRKGLAIREEILGTENTQTAESYYWMGEIYSKESDIQDFRLAMDYYNKAKSVREKIYGLTHQETLNVDYAIGQALINQGKPDEAIAYMKKCRDRIDAQEESNPNAIATAWMNTGIIYTLAGAYDNAITCFNKAIRCEGAIENVLTASYDYLITIHLTKGDYLTAIRESIEVLRITNNAIITAYQRSRIGEIYFNINDYTHALEYYDIALKGIIEAMGDGNSYTIEIREMTANVNYEKGDFAAAIKLYSEALDDRKKLLGEKNYDNAITYNQIGLSYIALEDYSQSIEYLSKALTIMESIESTEHPDTADIYTNLGLAYMNTGDYTKSADCYLKELSFKEKQPETDPIDIAICNYNIGMAYGAQGNHSEALKYYLKALPTIETGQASAEVNAAEVYQYIGITYNQLGDYGKAWIYFYKAMTIMEEAPTHHNEALANLYYWIGQNFSVQSYHQSALDYFNQAYTLYKAIFGETHPDTQSILTWIAQEKKFLG